MYTNANRLRSRFALNALLTVTMLLCTSITLGQKASPSREIDAEVSFATNFSNLVHDSALEQQIDQSSSTLTLSWIPVFWYFQLGPVLTNNVTQSRYPILIKSESYSRKDITLRRGAGLRGKINLVDIQTSDLVPWIGGTYMKIRVDQRTTIASEERPGEFYDYNHVDQIDEFTSEAGITIFMNRNLGLTINGARTLASTKEVPNSSEGSENSKKTTATERFSNRMELGISTFF